jgi:hypothetical protein
VSVDWIIPNMQMLGENLVNIKYMGNNDCYSPSSGTCIINVLPVGSEIDIEPDF